MKHVKPTIAMIMVIALLGSICYWPVQSLILIISTAILLAVILMYKILYDHFNKKQLN